MVVSLYMAEAELLAELELVVQLVVVLVQLQGRWEWMRKIGVDHNIFAICPPGVKSIL